MSPTPYFRRLILRGSSISQKLLGPVQKTKSRCRHPEGVFNINPHPHMRYRAARNRRAYNISRIKGRRLTFRVSFSCATVGWLVGGGGGLVSIALFPHVQYKCRMRRAIQLKLTTPCVKDISILFPRRRRFRLIIATLILFTPVV